MHLKILVLNVKTHLEMDTWRFNDFSRSPKTWRRESFREHLNVMASHSLVCIFSAEASESVSVVIKFRQNFFHWMFLTCCYCRGQPAAEQYWPPLHNILIQNTTAPVEWTNVLFIQLQKRQKKKTTKGNHMYMLLPTWRKEMNLPICICNSPSTTLVSDTVTKLHIKLFWFKMKNKSNEKWKIFWCRGAG